MKKFKKYIKYIQKVFSKYEWWQTGLFIVGVLAVLNLIGALFIAAGSSPERLYANGPIPPVASPEFRTALAHTVNAELAQGGSVQVLNNGDQFFPALLNDINNAKKTINFSVYIWAEGEASNQILDALIKKQKEGVQVRVLLDGLGGKSAPDDLFNQLKEAGGKVEKYRTPGFGKLTRFHRRNHRRAIVIDGQVGFVGGMAVKDTWIGNAENPEHWRDIMFRVTGPMARSLQDAFVDHWASSSGELLIGQDIFPEHFEDRVNDQLSYIHIASSPADDSLPIPKFMLLPMLAAQKELIVTTPYFVPDNNMLEVLKDKAKSGVTVKLLLPGSNIDSKLEHWNAQSYYQDLLKLGVQIYEYQPTFIHSKFFVVDGELSVIGSPNLNARSRRLDEENAFAVFDRGLAEELTDTFNSDIKNAKEIDYETWKKRNWLVKPLQFISKLVSEQS